ncbi:hypothetical protein [Hydrogenophaga electricum]|uniref:Uncharacterized protein n=1 Tax=Hydrogenophaga electricum TaxID=1230953 RepID=A0ABQ6C881_9BURK|nr:hypothetical protein [Hydrogenophaga electricum]GLS16571.1 hypothetical protein GCM10007935_40130 [Hydrogenophaga electricum]
MSFTSIIKIIKVNAPRSGIKDNRAWEMQDAECILLDDNGEEQQVGVLMLPKHLRGTDESGKSRVPDRGIYMASFALQASMRNRSIEAVLTDLRPYAVGKQAIPGSKPSAIGTGA